MKFNKAWQLALLLFINFNFPLILLVISHHWQINDFRITVKKFDTRFQLCDEPWWSVNNSYFNSEGGRRSKLVLKHPWDRGVTDLILIFWFHGVIEGGKFNKVRQIRVYYIDWIILLINRKCNDFWHSYCYFIESKHFTWQSRDIIDIKVEFIRIIQSHIIFKYYVYLKISNAVMIERKEKKLVIILKILYEYVQKCRFNNKFEISAFFWILNTWQKISLISAKFNSLILKRAQELSKSISRCSWKPFKSYWIIIACLRIYCPKNIK